MEPANVIALLRYLHIYFSPIMPSGLIGFDLLAHREGHLFTGGVYYTTGSLIELEAVMIVLGEKALSFTLA